MEENLFTPRCIRTFSGIYVNVFEPKPEMFCIEDIAHALSHQPRFGGHLPYFYSVAQHSYNCFLMASAQDKLSALLHDASEAYMCDIPKPIKNELSQYTDIEDKLMRCIAEKFQFEYPLSAEVKRVDYDMLVIEWYEIMLLEKSSRNILLMLDQHSSVDVKKMFLKTFETIKK